MAESELLRRIRTLEGQLQKLQKSVSAIRVTTQSSTTATKGDKGDPGIGLQGPPGDASDAYPVGALFLAVVATNPASLLGFGTWSQVAQGQFLVGFKTGDPDFGTVMGTGGAKTKDISHTHDIDHTHDSGTEVETGTGTQVNDAAYVGASGSGGSTTQDILPPYYTIYVWKRTA